MLKQLLHNINNNQNFWQIAKTAVITILIIGFILLIFIVNFAFLDSDYSSILGDPSRKIEHSSQYFFAGFIVLWILIIAMLFYSLILRHKIASQTKILPSISQKILKRLEKFMIFVSIVIGIIVLLRYFMRIFSLTSSTIYTAVLVILIFAISIIVTKFTIQNK